MKDAYLFLSYARVDRLLLDAHVRDQLEGLEIRSWFDDHMSTSPPADWWKEISERVTSSCAFVILLTDNWQKSDECRREFETARACGLSFILVQPYEFDDLPHWYFLRAEKYVVKIYEKGARSRLAKTFLEIYKNAQEHIDSTNAATASKAIGVALEKIVADNSTIKILGRGPDYSLLDVMLPLFVTENFTEQDEPIPLGALLDISPGKPIVLLGGPGTGKSTALQYLQIKAASGVAPAISIRGSFHRFARGQQGIERWAETLLRSHYGHHISDFESDNTNVSLVLLLDGLDEISDQDYERYVAEVINFVEAHPKIGLIVTSRPGRFEHSHLPGFLVFYVDELCTDDIPRYVKRNVQHESANDLLQALNADSRLAELTRTPFMLALLCAAHGSVANHPRERSLMYRNAIDFLLKGEDWQTQRTRPSPDKARLWRACLQRIATRLFMLESAGSFSKSELIGCIESEIVAPTRADDVLSEILNNTGLLQSDRDGYSFVHRSLWEYFVAEACLLEPVSAMCERAAAIRWEEPVRLYAGLLDQHRLSEAINGVWDHNPGLALRCMSEAAEFPAKLLRELYVSSPVARRVRIVEDLVRLFERSPRSIEVKRMVVDTGCVIAGAERHAEVLFFLISLLRRLGTSEASRLEARILQFDTFSERVSFYLLDSSYFLNFAHLEAGNFKMGADSFGDRISDATERPAHDVSLSPFWVSKYLVTNRLFYDAFPYAEDRRNEYSRGDRQPVNKVTWYEAIVFCWWLGACLPTDAQWEYMARSRDIDNTNLNDAATLPDFAWFGGNSGNITHDVGTKRATSREIYDVVGNLREWCWDKFSDDYYSECAAKGIVINPEGPYNGDRHVLRGGTFDWALWNLRPTYRNSNTPDNRNHVTGFRVAVKIDSPLAAYLED